MGGIISIKWMINEFDKIPHWICAIMNFSNNYRFDNKQRIAAPSNRRNWKTPANFLWLLHH
jgi:hypothetical protein